MAAPLLTYRDAYEHLLDVFWQVGKNVGIQDRRLRRAIMEAYRLLPSLHDWEYFRGTASILTSPPETHTATYTASTKRVVIGSGTWTEDATAGSVLISSVRYPVSRRVNDTTIELGSGPADDVSSSSVKWQRFKYLLPLDVGDVTQVVDPLQYTPVLRVTPSETFWWTEVVNSNTYPVSWSLFPSAQYPGRLEMWLSGSGQTQRTLRYLYRQRATKLTVDEINSGTVSVTDDVATFSSSVLTANCVGAVLRVSSDADAPTSDYGRMERDPSTGDETIVLRPAESEVIISSVTSGTEAVLLSPIALNVSTRGYTLSSHINVNVEGMWELFLRLCEEQYDVVTRAESAIRRVSYEARMESLRAAMIADGPVGSDLPRNHFRGALFVEEEA